MEEACLAAGAVCRQTEAAVAPSSSSCLVCLARLQQRMQQVLAAETGEGTPTAEEHHQSWMRATQGATGQADRPSQLALWLPTCHD